MSGAIRLFPSKPLWHGQGKLYLYLVYTLECLMPSSYDGRFNWFRELICIVALHIPYSMHPVCWVCHGSLRKTAAYSAPFCNAVLPR
jgi:hypothetical protein